MTRDWLLATDDEWAAEVARRWREIDDENQPDPRMTAKASSIA